MALKKPSDLFGNKAEDNNVPVIESDNTLREELIKVENLSEQVIQLQQELSQKVVKNDLESLVLSQINTMQENFDFLQNDFKKSNKKDIVEFKEKVSELTEIVGNLVENELPKYKKQVTKNEVRIGDKFDELKEVVEENIFGIREEIDSKVNDIAEVIDNNLEYFNNQLQETSTEVKKTTDTYNKLSKILENKVLKESGRNDLYIDEKFVELNGNVNENINGIRTEVDIKVHDIREVVNNNIDLFNTQLQETSSEIKKTTDTYNKLSKIVENRISKENEKLEEYSKVIQSIHEEFIELEESLQEKTLTYNQIIEEKFATISSDVKSTIHSIDENVNHRIDSIDEDVDTFKNQVSYDISSIKADVVIFEKHNKDTEKTIQEFSEQLYKISEIDTNIIIINEDIGKLQNQYDSVSNQSIETKKDLEVVERYIQNHHRELEELKEEVFGEIEQIQIGNIQENLERLEKKIDFIKETYSKIEPEVIVKEVIKEGLLNEPPDTKNSDPLTPLDQNFVTLDQLQKHYSLFINRIQQQLSTLGGGGETRLKYLDDIVGIATNASAYDGKYLKYNHSLGKFEFTDVDITNDSWTQGDLGPYTLGSVGIGTTNPQSALDVRGAITIGVGTVGINSVFSTTDIQSWYYTNKSKSVTGDDNTPQAIYVGAAGTAMFIVGDATNRIFQYTLSTPYDVSTAGVAVTFFSTATQDTNPTGIDFNTTGTKMFVSGGGAVAPLIVGSDYVHEYSLSTAWNVAPSSVGYTTSYNVTAQETVPQGVTFGNSGSKMYLVGSTGDAVYQYSLSTPYSLASGVTYDNISLILGTNPLLLEISPTDISFNSTGTVLWIVGNTQDRIYEFRLGTAWDISTAVFYDDVYIGFNEITVTGLHVIPEQNVAYIVGTSGDIVFQYSTNTPAIEIASSGISSVSSIVLNNETRVKDKLYVKGLAHFDTNIVTQGNIQVDGSATVAGTLTGTGNITLSGATGSNIVLGTNQTTATLIIGGATQTGTIILGQATTTQTVGIATGVTASGNTKTINLGTGGASGSRTLITVGSATAGAASTVFIPSPTNLGIGVTNPTVPLDVLGNATITNPSANALNIRSGATGSFASFNIGRTAAEASFSVVSAGAQFANNSVAGDLVIRTESASSKILFTNAATNSTLAIAGNNVLVGTISSTGTASQPLQVTGGAYVSGSVGIGTTNPRATLQVKDALAFETTNTTTSSTSQVAVDTFATATFRSAKYQVQMTCPGQIATLGGITTGGSGYTAGTFNVTFSNSSGTGAAAQGTLTISNGTVSQIGLGTTGGSGYTTGDVLTAAGGSGLQVSVASTASPSGRILTLGSITSAGVGYTAGVGVGTTTLAFLGGTGTGAVGLATIFDGVITSATLLQQPTTGTGGTVYYSGSNYTTSTVLTIAKTDVTNTIITITGSVGVSTFTSLTAHGIGVSDVVRVSSTSNGLTAGTDYYVVTTPTTTTFTLGSSVGIGTTFTTGSSLSIGFYRNSANAGGSVAYLNAITGVSTNYQVSDLLVLQDGTTADFVEYGTIANNDILGTFAADISGANARLLVTPTYATNTVKVARQAITV